MTDEWFTCGSCGKFNPKTELLSKVIGYNNWLTTAQVMKQEELFNAKLIITKQKVICECGVENNLHIAQMVE